MRWKHPLPVFLLLAVAPPACNRSPETESTAPVFADPLQWVDPFIGTGGQGFGVGSTYPGAGLPFGLVKVSPDTRPEHGYLGYAHCAGYSWEDDYITGFSHVHLHGTGASDYGNILFLPSDGMGPEDTEDEGRMVPFSHENESAGPGLYQVTLDDGIEAELTATLRTAMHRYTFPAGMDATVIIDLEHGMDEDGNTGAGGEIRIDPVAGTVEGWMWNMGSFTGRFEGNPVYFAARFDRPPTAWGTWADTPPVPGSSEAAGIDLGGWLSFTDEAPDTGEPDDTGKPDDTGRAPDTADTGGTPQPGDSATPQDTADSGRADTGATQAHPAQVAADKDGKGSHRGQTLVEVQVGISFTSLEQAWVNLYAEASGRSFEKLHSQAREAWSTAMAPIRVADSDPTDLTIFYTALFHSLQMPTLMSDVSGSYVGFDGQEHVIVDGLYYSDFSLWDTYRSLHPLLILAWPDYSRDFANSLLLMAQQGGYLPRWPCNRGYTGSMLGDPADIVLAETWLKGITGWDQAAAFEAARVTADGPTPEGAAFGGRRGIDSYLERGYVAGDETDGAASHTLEYVWADHALARWAEATGRTDAAAEYHARSTYYANTWDPELGFFRARLSDGTFEEGFSESSWEGDYTEGNAWQYLWMVPWDPEGLAELMGGVEPMLERLDYFFEQSLDEEDTWAADIWYWHGNEPDLDAAWLYALVDQPARGAPWIRWVRDTRYFADPAGLDGNDDGGTLSAWYVLSALGLHPIAGTDRYAIGPPLFPYAEVDLPGGLLAVEVTGEGSARWGSWQGASLNDLPISGGTLLHADLASGGLLQFQVGPDDGPLLGDRNPPEEKR